jgi:sulfite oxidase
MMAAGGAIDPFWQMYPFHKVDSVKSLLIKYKVGELHPDDQIKEEDLVDFSDMQSDGHERSKNLIKMQDFPYCAETNKKFLVDHFLTPPSELYVRNHNLVPTYDEDFEQEFQLQLELNSKILDGRKLKSYTLQELKDFPN